MMKIDNKIISNDSPTYFIVDIAANHDGDLTRAKDLIYLAKDAGADAAKFQHFQAKTIVSDIGFKSLGSQLSHQAKWEKSVYEVYDEASLNLDWTEALHETCQDAEITFFTSPYSFELVDFIDSYVPAYKIGSGDISWIEIIQYIATKNKPYILATGAANLDDVRRAVAAGLEVNQDLCLMQCNTNYTADSSNFNFINLNVLKQYKELFPNILLGLSDHTPGHATVLGAVALGARMIEKHFTDDTSRIGPDHKFSMDPISWREMVNKTRELESALGDGIKKVEHNEIETVILQRRSSFAAKDINIGQTIQKEDIIFLRPALEDGYKPYEVSQMLGLKSQTNIKKGNPILYTDLQEIS
jgi:N-acetylneuraminate synthase